MATIKAPKQWCLTKHETINTFHRWKDNMLYTLAQDIQFAVFLAEGTTWEKKTSANPLRGLTDDGMGVPVARRLNAFMKNTRLELMLGQIANYCTVISRSTIIKGSTSLEFIWQKVREHYGFQLTGAHFLDLVDI